MGFFYEKQVRISIPKGRLNTIGAVKTKLGQSTREMNFIPLKIEWKAWMLETLLRLYAQLEMQQMDHQPYQNQQAFFGKY